MHPSLISKFEIRGCKGTWLNSTVEKTRGSIPGGVTSFTTIKSTSVITSLITKNNKNYYIINIDHFIYPLN